MPFALMVCAMLGGAYEAQAAPTVSVSLPATPPKTNDILTATASGQPAGTYTYSFVWTRKVGNNQPFPVQTTSNTTGTDSLNLATPNFGDRGDLISVTVTATDGSGTSAPAAASTTVANTFPVMRPILLSTSANRSFLGRPEFIDDDNDPIVVVSVTKLSGAGSITNGTFDATNNPDNIYLYNAPAAASNDSFLFAFGDSTSVATNTFQTQTAAITVTDAIAAGANIYTAFGASDAQGYGASDYNQNYTTVSPAKSYAPLLAANDKLGGVYPNLVLSRRAINGLTLAGATRSIGGQTVLGTAIADHAKAYTVWLGPNDVLLELLPQLAANPANSESIKNNYVAAWKTGYAQMATALQSANPTSKFAAISIPDLGPNLGAYIATRTGQSTNSPAIQAISAAVTDACAQMSAQILASFPNSVDIQKNGDLSGLPPIQAAPLVFNPSTDLYIDGYHPNDSGYDRLAKRLFRLETNTAPVASGQSITLVQNQATTVNLVATDAENDTLRFKITSLPAHGKLREGSSTSGHLIVAGELPYTLTFGNQATYIPDQNYSGSDSFVFRANDGKADSSLTATVNLTVNAVNPATVVDLQATGQVSVSRFGLAKQRNGHYTQSVVITNTTANPISGPIILTIDNLIAAATLFNLDGTTTTAPVSPYKTVALANSVILPGQSVVAYLDFTVTTSPINITYNTRVLQGGPF